MNKIVTKHKNKCETFKSIRVKESTKLKTTTFLRSINSPKKSEKITFDILINFFIDNSTDEDIEKLQLSVLTWKVEGERIRALYERDCGVLSDNLWFQFVQTDDYREFAMLHSRLPLPWKQSEEMFTNKRKKWLEQYHLIKTYH